jgi:hypothetical protein
MSEEKINIEHPRNLQQKLREHMASTGQLSSSDVAAFQRGSDPEEQPQHTGAAMHEATVVDKQAQPAEDKTDAMILAAGGPTDTQQLEESAEDTTLKDLNPMERITQRRNKVVITPADKEAFIMSVIHNTRMELTFQILGGRVTVRVRSRKVPETRAIVAREQFELTKEIMKTRMDYTLRLRSMLMTAQIAEFRGEVYEEMQAPLQPVVRSEGGAEDPGWVKWIDYWAQQGDGIHALLWNCIQTFEDKYWRMVEDAQNADFWQPAASISA